MIYTPGHGNNCDCGTCADNHKKTRAFIENSVHAPSPFAAESGQMTDLEAIQRLADEGMPEIVRLLVRIAPDQARRTADAFTFAQANLRRAIAEIQAARRTSA